MEQCLHADYLTLGFCSADQAAVLEVIAAAAAPTAAAALLPSAMQPLQLHKGQPVPLPNTRQRVGAELADQQQWQRRQFSRLWAPMPADYQLDGVPSSTSSGAGDEEVDEAEGGPRRKVRPLLFDF